MKTAAAALCMRGEIFLGMYFIIKIYHDTSTSFNDRTNHIIGSISNQFREH